MRRILRAFIGNRDGVAYLEFAVCLPFLVALLMGAIEVTRFIIIAQKVEKTAATLSDVISQGKTVSAADLNNMIFASSQVMQPYSMGPGGYVIVSSVKQTGAYSVNNPAMVDWQYTSSGVNGSWTQSSRIGTAGQAANLPGGMTLNDKDNIIVTEIFYNYLPMIITNGVIGSSTIYKVAVFKPRLGDLSTLSSLPCGLFMKGAFL
jgi:Flp pilus assembly protein TadG